MNLRFFGENHKNLLTFTSVLVAEELSIRRTAASNIYNCGAGIKLTADILGHE